MPPPLLKRNLSQDSETEFGDNQKKLAVEAHRATTTTTTTTTATSSTSTATAADPPAEEGSPFRDMSSEPPAASSLTPPPGEVDGLTMGSAVGRGGDSGQPPAHPDAPYVPEGAEFAVVLSPRRGEPTEERAVAESPGSRQVSTGPPRRHPKEELEKIRDQEPTKFLLYWYRQIIQARHRRVTTDGPAALDSHDVDLLSRTLGQLAFYLWPEDKAQREDYMTSSGVGKAVRLLLNASHYGDDISEMAAKLLARWQAGDFKPAGISFADDNLISDDSDSEDEARPASLQNRPAYSNGFVKHLMRGVSRYYTAKGSLSSRLDSGFQKRDAHVFGHNGLIVGDWWPFQLCCLRDGAHGSRQGGIAGRIASGAFSIVVSGLSEYKDRDSGDELYYSGTIPPMTGPDDTAATQTNATKALAVSSSTRKPVRVLRKGPNSGGRGLYPACGYRYDGLYTVVGSVVVAGGRGKRDFWRFQLVRNAGQPPIDRNRPNKDEIAAYNSLTA